MDQAKQDAEFRKYLKMIAYANKWHQVILRGCLTGIFAALGTTIGFAILLVALSQFVTTFKQVPLLDTILEQTKLDVLIEQQLNKINQPEQPTEEKPEEETPEITSLKYTDNQFKLSFNYPSTFSSINTLPIDEDSKTIQLEGGNGVLQSLDIYINQDIKVQGQGTQRYIPKAGMDRIIVNVYEDGATVGAQTYQTPVYASHISVDGNTFDFIGIGDAASPKLAREVFLQIIESSTFK